MLSVLAMLPMRQPDDMDGPDPQEVMREYFARRVKALTRPVVAKLLKKTDKAVDHIKRGRNKVTGAQLALVTDAETTVALFGALAGLATELAAKASSADAAAVAAGRARQTGEANASPRPTATAGGVPKGRPAKQSPGKPPRRSASPSAPGSGPGTR